MQSYFSKELYEFVKKDELISSLIKNAPLEGFNYCDINNPEDSILDGSFWEALGFEMENLSNTDVNMNAVKTPEVFKTKLDNFFSNVKELQRTHDQLVRYTHKNGVTVLIRSYGLYVDDNSKNKLNTGSLHYDILVFNNKDRFFIDSTLKPQSNASIFDNDMFFELLDKIGKGVLVYSTQNAGKDFYIKDTNSASATFFGMPKNDIVGKLLYDTFLRKNQPELPDALQDFYASDKETFALDIAFKAKGKTFWRRSSFAKLNANDIIEIFDDTTAQIADEDKLKLKNDELASKEKEINKKSLFFTQLLGNVSTGIIVVSSDEIIQYCNDRACDILELKSYDVNNKKLSEAGIDFIHEDFSKIPPKSLPFNLALSNGKESLNTVLGIFNPKTHQKKWIIMDVRLMDDSAANEKMAVISITDITFRKTFEAEISKSKEDAEEKDRLKSLFLANMSHEIRTPMNGILGFTELLKDTTINSEEFTEYISIVEKSGQRLLNIINDIIDISKIESGQMHLVYSETSVNEQLEFIHGFFKPEVEAKGMSINIQKGLTDKDSMISTDAEKLYAVFTNLVKNAIKYGKKGSIDVGYKIKNNQLEFFVKDQGQGIPKENQHAIFNRFERANLKMNKAVQGAGLGLSISKAYVEMLGGKIWFESTEGQGTTFLFTHPYNAVHPSDSSASETIDPRGKPLKVLVAEEDETAYMLIEIALRSIHHTMIRAKSGLEAVELCIENPDVDLILMDIKMPEMDGYEATRNIRQFNNDVVIIAQTAYGLIGDRERALEAGCSDYISKPVKQSSLIDLIKKFFNTAANKST